MQRYLIKHPDGKKGKENNFLFIGCYFLLLVFEFHTFRPLCAPWEDSPNAGGILTARYCMNDQGETGRDGRT